MGKDSKRWGRGVVVKAARMEKIRGPLLTGQAPHEGEPIPGKDTCKIWAWERSPVKKEEQDTTKPGNHANGETPCKGGGSILLRA